MTDPVRLVHRNRALVDVVDPTDLGAGGVTNDTFQRIVDTLRDLSALLPLSLRLEYWMREHETAEFGHLQALGLEGGLSAKKWRALLRLAGASENLQKIIGNILPSLSAGGAVAVGDNDTVMRIDGEVNILPAGIQRMFDKWQDSLTIGPNPIRMGFNVQVSNTESWLGGFFSPSQGMNISSIDNVTEYSFNAEITANDGTIYNTQFKLTVDRKTYPVTGPNGEVRIVTVEQVYQTIGLESVVLQALGIDDKFRTGAVISVSAWDYSTRQELIAEIIDDNQNAITEVRFPAVAGGQSVRANEVDTLNFGNGTQMITGNGETTVIRDNGTEITRTVRREDSPWSGIISSQDKSTGAIDVIVVVGSRDGNEALYLDGSIDAQGNLELGGRDPESLSGQIIKGALNETRAELDGKDVKSDVILSLKDGKLVAELIRSEEIQYGKRLNIPSDLTVRFNSGRFELRDSQNRSVEIEYYQNSQGEYLDAQGNVVTDIAQAAIRRTKHKDGGIEVLVERERDDRNSVRFVTVKAANSPIGVDFQDAGSILGNVLGNYVGGDNVVERVVGSAALSTILGNVGEVLNLAVFSTPGTKATVGEALKGLDAEFLANLKSAGVGALSSMLTAELVNALGLTGITGELANTAAGYAIGQIATNIAAGNGIFDGLSFTQLGNAVGGFIGSKLASEIVTFDTIGGQIGSAVGSSLGVIAASELLKIGGVLGGPIGAAIGAFVGFIAGGLIGSLFGGTPRSGADTVWDAEQERFVVANAYSRKGGSKDAAVAMASAVAETLNAVLDAAGGKLADPSAVQGGNYGMRKSDYVYRPRSTRDKDAITFRLSSKNENAFGRMVGYGIHQSLTDPDFQIIGGSHFVKRAIYATFEVGGVNPRDFDQSILLGNLATAQAYANYLQYDAVINALVGAEGDSALAAETLLTLSRAADLGLNRRHRSDWFGGFSALLDEGSANAADVTFTFDYDPFSDQVHRLIGVGEFLLLDYIDVAGQTTIEAGDSDDTINVLKTTHDGDGFVIAGGGGLIADSTGLRVNGHSSAGSAVTIEVAATIDAGGGDDIVHAGDMGNNVFGGAGNDTLYGGRLDDWLLGGDGNDTLDAGDGAGLGGDGNYLDGGAGNDIVTGREGSDWLEGGDGVDHLTGGGGDDILAGGAGDGDILEGGLDDDQYLVRRGDGVDSAEDEPNGVRPTDLGAGDYVSKRMAGLLSGIIKRNWVGDAAGVSGKAAIGGEDAIVFGAGIELGDIVMQRSTTDPDDLIVKVMQTVDGVVSFSGTQLTVKDWFADYFKRVEWIKFADGTEVRIGDITSFIIGGSGNDVLIGTAGNDFVYGGDGDDQLHLLAGNDIGNGGTGNDLVAGHSGQDLLVGGLGVDQLIGGKGKDALSGDGSGDDLYGGDEDDILSGGRGDGDVVVGGAGNDTFKYSRGDGRDEMFDDYSAHWDVVWTKTGLWNEAAGYHYDPATGEVTGPGGVHLRKNVGTADEPNMQWLGRFDFDDISGTLRVFNPPAGSAVVANNGTDTIEFAPGINIQDIVLSQVGNNLVLHITSENSEFGSAASITDSITIKDWYAGPGQIERLAFYQTGILDISAGVTRLIAGTDAGDGSDATPLAGTSGADWITGGAGDDVIAGGSSNDIIAGNSGSDRMKGEAGDDVMYGGAGNDVLDGGTGKDVLIGGSGLDTASYASAGSGVRAHLSAGWANSTDAVGDEYSSIENLQGGGGTDLLGGDDGDNELTGGLGNDTLLGGEGDDTYVWGLSDGADIIRDASFTVEEAVTAAGALADGYAVSIWQSTGILQPGYSNRYYWRLQVKGPGGEVVYDYDKVAPTDSNPPLPPVSSWNTIGWLGGFARTNGAQVTREKFDTTINAGEDVLELGPGISLSDLSFIASGTDLVIRYGGNAASQVTIKDHFIQNSRIEALQFSDGLSVSLASILTAADGNLLVGTASDDLMLGRDGGLADQLDGGVGNDTLSGGTGNDALSGGDGDDVLEGGAGGDQLHGGANSASTEVGWGDTVRYVRSAAGVQVDLRNTTTGQTGGDAAGDILTGIENVVGSQLADTLTGDSGDNRLFGLGGNDVLDGGDGANVLVGGEGDDTITGGAGEDNVDGGEGADTINGLDGDDLVQAGAGNDQVLGGAGDDQLLGHDGDDRLEGGMGADELLGDGGADTLLGGDGHDTLAGGAGGDTLRGEAGDDVYLFDAGSGSDTILDAQGVNSIVFDEPVGFDDLWLTRQGDDLRIAVIGGGATITVTGFFAAANPTKMRSISTATHSLYLDHAHPLIGAMTTANVNTPDAMPASLAPQLASYWHQGHKAKPTGSPMSLTVNEDVATPSTAINAVDHDGNISGYRIGASAANGAAVIDPATGAFVYTPNADFNGADSFTVVVTDADGNAAEVTVNVGVTAVNDAPRNAHVQGGGTLNILEGADPGASVGQIAATDVEGDNLTFSLVNDAGGRFDISTNGALIVQSSGLLDHEAASSHVIRVRVTDALGAATEADFTVIVANRNEAPDNPQLSEARGLVGESLSGGLADSWVARFALSDVDGTTPTLQLVSNPSGRFKVVGNEVRFADGYEPDFESLYRSGLAASDSDGDGQLEVVLSGTVNATDGSLSSPGGTSFSIRVEDVNEAPTALNWAPGVGSVAERDRVANGTSLPAIAIGTLSVTDSDIAGFADATYSYSVSDSRFEVVGNVLRLKQGAVLDFEAGSSVSLTITATDQSSAPLSIQQTISIAVGDQDDVVEGDANGNSLTGQQNRDRLYGFGGDDTLDGGAGDDLLDGGAGSDRLIGGDGVDSLHGGDGVDVIRGDAGDDVAFGGNDNDVLYGGDGNDALRGDDGDDVLIGGLGADQLDGGAGSDWADYSLVTEGAASTGGLTADLASSASNTGAALGDTYVGIENLRGTSAANSLRGDAAANRIEGLAGDDSLRGREGDDTLLGGTGTDTLYGDEGADTLRGDDGDDVIYGGAGNDTLLGGAGNDQLYAESGDDYLDGGAGNDILNGGIDNDTYIVTRTSDADTIFNYDPSGEDIDVIGFQDSDGPINYDDLWFERVGNDMRISVIGTSSSVLVKDWYLISDATTRANYKIDFIASGERVSKQIDVESLVQLMAARTKPATAAERDALMADQSYKTQWDNHWGYNKKPVMSAIGNQAINEDGAIVLGLTVTDDITPHAGIQMSATVISGNSVIADNGLAFGAPDSNGQRSLTITPVANMSGTAIIRVQATDAGGLTETREFTVTVNPVADTPTVAQFTGGAGTAGQAGGIPLDLSVTFPDADGSEAQQIWISGVPAGVTLSAGTYDSAAGVWKLTPAQASGLKVIAPAGWSQNLSLSATARATEGGQTAVSAAKTTTVVINAPPTGASFSGSVNENSGNGKPIGTVVGIDPDTGEGDTLTYTLIDNAGGRFALSLGGALTVANGSLLNYEAATSHTITVRVTDSFNQWKEQALVVTINNVNEQNSFAQNYAMSVSENVAVGTLIGSVSASDPDSSATAFGQQRYYFWYNGTTSDVSYDGRYRINAVTGQITTAAAINFEGGNTSVSYSVFARDNAGASPSSPEAWTTVTIGINNVNEPNNVNGTALYVNENVAAGTVVGTATVGDADSSSTAFGQQRFWFWDGTNYSSQSWDGRYVIDNVTGVIKTNAALNREAPEPGRNYVVRARDNQGNPGYHESAGNFWIEIANVNEAPNSSGGNHWAMFDETGLGSNPANGGVVVRTLPLSDPDGTTPTLEFVSNPGGWFQIVGNQIRFTGAHLDFEWFRNNGYGVADYDGDGRIEAHIADVWTRTNDGQYASEGTVTQVFIHDINEPHWLSNGTYSFGEGTYPVLATVANAGSMLNEPDSNRAKSWSFADGSLQSGIFQINGSTGEISLINGSVDYESLVDVWETQMVWVQDPYDPYGGSGWYEEQSVYMGRDPSRATFNLGIKATDGTFTSTATATVTVTDVNEGPTIWTRAGNAGDTDSGTVYTKGLTTFWVRANRNEGQLVLIYPTDPENASSTYYYSMTAPQVQEILYYYGGSSEADGRAPVLSLTPSGTSGTLSFSSSGDGEWEGAYRDANGNRRTSTLYYRFDLSVRDVSGVTSVYPFEIVFLRRDSSVPPIVFDLDGDGLELVSSDTSTVHFDMDEDGVADRTGWVGADDGLLALDRNGNGLIDDINEISFANDVAGAISDLEGLRAFDTNANGFFDSGDERFAEFRVWQDANQDGISQVEELRSLAEAGIAQVNLTFNATGATPDGPGNVIYATTEYLRTNGTTGTVGDVFFSFEPSDVEEIAAPVIFDFDGDGAGLISLTASKVRFDMDGDGGAERTGWIESGDAFLALDRNNDGEISDIAEISFVGDLEGAKTDLEGLKAFDSNGDLVLSALDQRFAEFKLWFDSNGNGVSDAGEIKSLAEAGVTSLNLTSTAPANRDDGGNIIYGIASYSRSDGTTGRALDAGLAYAPGDGSAGTSHSAWNGTPTPSTSDEPFAPAISVERQEYERKAKKYRLSTANGQLFVRYRNDSAVLDERAGLVGPATVLKFKNKTYGLLSPIILDLDGDGVEMRSIKKAKASFDMNGDGVADNTGWVGKGDGFLVIDRNGDGRITTASELSFLTEKPNAKSDLDALGALDSNRDGKIDSSDARFGELKIWVDRDGDGVTDDGELKSLADHGVASISLAGRATEQEAKIGSNMVVATSTFTRADGSTGSLADVALSYRPGKSFLSHGTESDGAANNDLLKAMRAAMAEEDIWQGEKWQTQASVAGDGNAMLAANGKRNSVMPDREVAKDSELAGAPELDQTALMRQAMAGFGGRAGELDLVRRHDDRRGPFDFYAAA